MIVHNVEGLLPCPFCGAEAELVTNSSGDDFVRCTNKLCAARTRLHHENKNGPINQWNSRMRESCHVDAYLGDFFCSECGVRMFTETNYCPNCGRRVMA